MARAKKNRSRGGDVRWVKVIGGGVLAVLVLAVVSVFALWIWLKAYLHGEAFRDMVSAKTSALFRAEGDFEEIQWTGSLAYSDGYAARGGAGAPFSRVKANGIRAYVDFGAVRQGIWQIDEIDVNRLVLLVDRGEDTDAEEGDAGSAGTIGEEEAGAGAPGFLKSLIPSTVEIGEVEVADTNFVAHLADGRKISLDAVETAWRPLSGSAAWSLFGKGGELTMTDAPEMKIDTFAARLRGEELFITDAALSFHEGAVLTCSGEMRFGPDTWMDLRLKFANLDVDDVLASPWRERVSGHLEGEYTLRGKPGDAAGLRRSGWVRMTKGVIESVGVLDLLADYAKAERFRRLVLHEATADFDRFGDEINLTNIVLQSDGLTRVTGRLTMVGDRMEGAFRVGITPGTLKWIPGAEQKVFVEAGDGFLWTDMNLTGTLEEPKEDLSARLASAAVQQVAEDTVEKAKQTAEKAIESPEDILDAARKVMEENPELIEKGRKLLESLFK